MIIDQWRADLTTVQPVSIAAPESASTNATADLPVVCDPWGTPQVPVTGLVGSLRAHAELELGPARCRTIFGADLALATDDDEQQVQPSSVRFLGSALTMPGPVAVVTQTAVGRWSAAAADKSLRAREAIPIGATVSVYLTAEDLPDAALADFKTALTTWRPVLGGSYTTGLGDAKVTHIWHRRLDLAKQTDLAIWLAGGGPKSYTGESWDVWESVARGLSEHAHSWAFLIDGDLRIGTGKPRPSEAATSAKRGSDYVIPGSAWKGVFRSRAEFILRTCGMPTCNSTDEDCCTEPTCPTCTLFGWSGRAGSTGEVGARGTLRFHTSTVTEAQTPTRSHVAIDRFTGGARRGQLYKEKVLCGGRATLTVDIPPDAPTWAQSLLDWVTLDIHDGFVGIGHGTSRGMGTLRLVDADAVRARAGDLTQLMRDSQEEEVPRG
ncbi:MAG: RAMP superfamily CRISPR-associated protein [Candidatus Nanopelagicales bacterium]